MLEDGKGSASGAEKGESRGEGGMQRKEDPGIPAAAAATAYPGNEGTAGAVKLMREEYEAMQPVAKLTNSEFAADGTVEGARGVAQPEMVAASGSARAPAVLPEQRALPKHMLARISGSLLALLQALAMSLKSPFGAQQ